MFELAISYAIFGMATSNLNKISIYNKKMKSAVATPLKKKTCLIEQFYRLCSDACCHNENQLNVTLEFPLAKVTFN